MNIVVATSAPFFWQPQAECLAKAMRCHGHEARVATLHDLARFRGQACDVLFCFGSGESLQPIIEAVPAVIKMLYLIESVPTLTESDTFTQGKLAAHRDYLHQFSHVFVHTRRSISPLQTLGVRNVEPLVWPHFEAIYHPRPAIAQDVTCFSWELSPRIAAKSWRVLKNAAKSWWPQTPFTTPPPFMRVPRSS